MVYRPDQRPVPCEILTAAGWCQGTAHVPRTSFVVEHLNTEHDFLKLTQFEFMGRGQQIEFFALQRAAVILLLLPDAERTSPLLGGDSQPRLVHCLLEQGMLQGRVRLRKGIRVSDFWMHQQGFVVMEDCLLKLGASAIGDDLTVEQRLPLVVVNAKKVIGISEEGPMEPTGEPGTGSGPGPGPAPPPAPAPAPG